MNIWVNRSKPVLPLFLFIVFAVISALPATGQDISSEAMLEKAEQVIAPNQYYEKIEIFTEKPAGRDKTMVMETYYKKGTGTFMEIVSPARSRGIRFLQKNENLWMFNPRSNSRRAIRLSPRESFQGTVFSNSDVGDPQYTDDYSTEYGKAEEIVNHDDLGSVDCFVIIGMPKHPKAAYGKIKMWIEKESLIPLKLEYYAKSGMLFKVMTLSNIERMAGRRRPTQFTMHSKVEKDSFSRMTILEMELRDNIPARKFNQQAITR